MTKIINKWITIVMCKINLSNLSKKKRFKSNTHKETDKCKHMELTIEKPHKNNVDEIFYAYIVQHNKKYDY